VALARALAREEARGRLDWWRRSYVVNATSPRKRSRTTRQGRRRAPSLDSYPEHTLRVQHAVGWRRLRRRESRRFFGWINGSRWPGWCREQDHQTNQTKKDRWNEFRHHPTFAMLFHAITPFW